ncbi:MAG TPA: hypothetical protein VK753_07610 [Xanthomonadaceae bacterium]|jgi:hypothetical protein|nr:hypothetical protein [Xanthomonadaceae bacterium]
MTNDETSASVETDEQPETATGAFRFVTSWRAMTHDDNERVREFWRSHDAIANPADADKRLAQVVMYAVTPDGEVAGVSTAMPMLQPRFGQPMYYFRAFVGTDWRRTKLVRDLTNRSCDALEAFARERGFPCIGVLLELENEGFYRALRKPVWWNPRFHYVGKSDRGLEVRAHYFEGARLKSAEEVRQIRLPSHP